MVDVIYDTAPSHPDPECEYAQNTLARGVHAHVMFTVVRPLDVGLKLLPVRQLP